jgi:LmbE family N-acetylglucosaminyl deacetylase
MSPPRIILGVTPKWTIQLATSLRCLLRCSVICGPIAFQEITDKPTLIVAPHPDDETFGCGGLIKLKRASGVRVRVVILTNGEGVASGLCEHPATVVSARKREALEACQRLGIDAESVRWLQLPDSKLPHPDQPNFDVATQALPPKLRPLRQAKSIARTCLMFVPTILRQR